MQTISPGLLDLLSLESELELWRFEHAITYVTESSYAFFVLVADTNRLCEELVDYSLQRLDGKSTTISFKDLDQLREAWDNGISWAILNVHGAADGDIAAIARSLQGNRDWMAAHRKKLIIVVSSLVIPKLKRASADFFALVQYSGNFKDQKALFDENMGIEFERNTKFVQVYQDAKERLANFRKYDQDEYLIHKAWLAQIEAAKALEKWEEVRDDSQKLLDTTFGLEPSFVRELLVLAAQANIQLGEYDKALDYCRLLFDLPKEVLSQRDQIVGYSLNSEAFAAKSNFDEALLLARKAEAIARILGDKRFLSFVLRDLGHILHQLGRFDEELEVYNEVEQIAQESNDDFGLASGLNSKANLLIALGRSEEAMRLLSEAEMICKRLGKKQGLSSVMLTQALILETWGRTSEAIEKLRIAEKIDRELKDRKGLASTLNNLSKIYSSLGRLNEAMALDNEQEALVLSLGDQVGLARVLNNQAAQHFKLGDLDESMKKLRRSEAISIELGKVDILAYSLGNQALIWKVMGDYEKAMEMFERQEVLASKIGDYEMLLMSLESQGNILRRNMNLNGAMDKYKEAEKISLRIGAKSCLALSYCNQAAIMYDWKRFEEALALSKQAIMLAKDTDSELEQLLQSRIDELMEQLSH